ncbi:MAG: NADH:flavin oxidoreductase [Desulfobacterales bacterium]|jgi:2,4-dienoyl-CoA reductase-like NADH-dependent reductase (Old Yellow Enzyme family)
MPTDIFSEFNLNGYTLRNRLGVAPMTRMSSVADSIPRQDVLDFLVRRAENGAALVFTEAIVTDYESAQGYPGQARLLTQRQIDAWKPVTEAIRHHGAVSVLQMFHCGRMAWPEINPAGRSIAPSPLTPKQDNPLTGKPYPVPDQASKFDIDHVIQGFVETAKGAMVAGFDGVEIHGAHGYLINQFLSTYANQRTDEYGGPLENRYRLAHEIIAAVRTVVPRERLLTFRISNWGVADPEVSLFATREEWQDLIIMLTSEPLDAISVSTYDFQAPGFGTDQTIAQLTRAVSDLPLMICGKIHDRDNAQAALAHADVVLSAKSFLLNPDFVNDVRDGKELALYSSAEANVAYTEEPLP